MRLYCSKGSVLGPLLFLIYINDLPDCLSSPVKAKIFADDTKIYFHHSTGDTSPFVSSLSAFCDWASNWQLSIAFQKCNVISFGKQVSDTSYSLCGITLEQVSYIRDLGVYVSSDFKPGIHCSSIAAKAYSRCALLLKGFHTSDVSILLRVFKTYVRPLLEFNTPVWNPWLFKDIEHIEGVQRYFTREIYKRARLPHMDYASRLANLNLSSLEYHCVYFDLSMCYKIVNKLLDIDAAEMFTVISNVHSTRGNSYRLQSVTIPRHDFRLYFFSSRVVPIWNSLPQHVVSAKNIITFMCHLKTVDLSPFC